MSFDIKSGYPHLRRHPDMRAFFLFRYAGLYYRFIAVSFGWGPSDLCFNKLMRSVMHYIRYQLCWRLFPYLEDILLAPARP